MWYVRISIFVRVAFKKNNNSGYTGITVLANLRPTNTVYNFTQLAITCSYRKKPTSVLEVILKREKNLKLTVKDELDLIFSLAFSLQTSTFLS